ncbi:hypothetical protein CSOJ01_00300 [Colletotrichum sojae]|uniref:Uncharacterized protein n=1 Tax=Colletotrichum sojae TaxID=2175907 RepID=A0A8H6JXT3_9PEZI|nr:hypothetical protein CSOJ01_00300 [Colletotrichum sojae]
MPKEDLQKGSDSAPELHERLPRLRDLSNGDVPAIHRSRPLGSMPIRRFVFADRFMTSAPVMAREQLVRQLRDRDSTRRIASAAHLATYIALY